LEVAVTEIKKEKLY